MLFGAELTIKGYNDNDRHGLELLNCSYSFQRTIDHNGRSRSPVVCGLINFEMVATKQLFLLEAMLISFKTLDGTITFRDSLANGESYTAFSLKFKGGEVIDFADNYSTSGYDGKMLRRVSLAIKEIILIGAEEISYDIDANNAHS